MTERQDSPGVFPVKEIPACPGCLLCLLAVIRRGCQRSFEEGRPISRRSRFPPGNLAEFSVGSACRGRAIDATSDLHDREPLLFEMRIQGWAGPLRALPAIPLVRHRLLSVRRGRIPGQNLSWNSASLSPTEPGTNDPCSLMSINVGLEACIAPRRERRLPATSRFTLDGEPPFPSSKSRCQKRHGSLRKTDSSRGWSAST